jgi:hypothetical protein
MQAPVNGLPAPCAFCFAKAGSPSQRQTWRRFVTILWMVFVAGTQEENSFPSSEVPRTGMDQIVRANFLAND